MAISVSPSSVHFGSTATGNKIEREVTVSNSEATPADVTISIVGGATGVFTVSPSSNVTVPSNGTVTLTTFFEPTAQQSYSAQLRVHGTGAPVTCALSGTGTAPSGWQQEAGSYLLMKVPDYGDGTFETRNGPMEKVTMTSYLRLGTFDWSQESPTAKELLKLLPQTGIGGDPVRDDPGEGYGGHYPDFDYDSVNAFEDLPPVKLITDGKDCKKTANREVFFNDDVRVRPQDCAGLSADDDPGHGLTMAQRQLESARLYSRGGWRDHSDGNRISTTYGDKVEVIRGNYRMLVMGRQDDPAEGLGVEGSGSCTLEYAPGMMAGAAVYVEWVPDYKLSGDDGAEGVWLMTNTTQNCYIYDRNAGNFREEVWGDVHESYTGQENPPGGAAGTEAGRFATDSSPLPAGHEPPFRVPGLNYDIPNSAGSRLAPNFKYDNTGLVRSNPHIIEKTWARRIDSWTGSETTPVPTISEKTWANYMYSTTGSEDEPVTKIEEKTWVTDSTEETNCSGTAKSTTIVGSQVETTTAGSIAGATTAGSIADATTAGSIVESTVAGFHLELEVSNHVEIEVGVGHAEISVCPLHFELAVSAHLDITLGASYEIKLGKHGEFKTKEDRAKLKETKAALTISESYLKSDHVCLEQKLSALSAAITALKVNLGS